MSVGLQYSNNVQRMAVFVSMVNVLILTAILDVSVTQDTDSHRMKLSVSVGLQYSSNVQRMAVFVSMVDGSFRCICNPGYRLSPDEAFCVGRSTV